MAFGLDDAIAAGLAIANKLIPDPAERAKNEITAAQMKQNGEFKQLEAVLSEAQELTKRQQNDMASDSWLSKNIRPLIMIYLLALVTFAGFEIIKIKDGFLALVQSFTEYGLMFYFGGRTIEKVASMVSGMKKDKV